MYKYKLYSVRYEYGSGLLLLRSSKSCNVLNVYSFHILFLSLYTES